MQPARIYPIGKKQQNLDNINKIRKAGLKDIGKWNNWGPGFSITVYYLFELKMMLLELSSRNNTIIGGWGPAFSSIIYYFSNLLTFPSSLHSSPLY